MPLIMSNGDIPDIIIFNGQEVEKVANTAGGFLWEKNTSPERWQFNENLIDTIGSVFEEPIDFTSDGVVFNSMKVVAEDGGVIKLMYDGLWVYNSNTNAWSSSAYRTVAFDHAPLGKIRKWLQLNATLQ